MVTTVPIKQGFNNKIAIKMSGLGHKTFKTFPNKGAKRKGELERRGENNHKIL